MYNSITFNGKNLFNEFGVYISGQGTFGAPDREYTFYDVPARDGSILGIGSKLNNISVSYEAGIVSNFDANIQALRSFLLSTIGYARLTDTYHPNEYRMALYEGSFSPNVEKSNEAAKFVLTFNCLPQRFLTSGEAVKSYTATGSLSNPTHFDAKPLIHVYGYGNFSITASGYGGVQVEIANPSVSDFYIDCETMNIYSGSTNLASYVAFRKSGASQYGVDAPVLRPGSNSITKSSSTITKLEITPRWWEV